MSTSPHKRLVQSILEYLEACERAASLRNHRATVQHFQECWLIVHQSFFGSYSVPSMGGAVCHQSTEAVSSAARPLWFEQKYSRPVRRVIARVSETGDASAGAGGESILFDVLECGHKLLARHRLAGGTPARHRWCAECSPKGKDKCQTTERYSSMRARSC